MFKKKVLFILILIIILASLPVYSQGFGNINVFKLVGQLILMLVIFIAMIFITLYGTKLVAKNAGGMVKSKYIQLLDAINLPGGSKIVIAKINDKIYILSIDSNGSNIIDIIEEEKFPLIEDNFDKDSIMNKYNHSKVNKNIKLFYENQISKRIRNKEDKNHEKED